MSEESVAIIHDILDFECDYKGIDTEEDGSFEGYASVFNNKDLGNDVICVDKELDKIQLHQNGKVPIYEPGLSELVVKNYKNKRL